MISLLGDKINNQKPIPEEEEWAVFICRKLFFEFWTNGGVFNLPAVFFNLFS